MELLLDERNARREWSEMPVDMSHAVIRSEAENVEPVGQEGSRDRAAKSIHAALKGQVFGLREVTDDVSAMFDRSDERSAAHCRVLRQEGDAEFVLVHDVLAGGIAHQIADEAPAVSAIVDEPLGVRRHVD